MNVLETQIWIRIRRGTIRSRAEAARFFGVSRPTASLAAERLIEAGLLKETGRGISSGGRAPTLLSVVPGCFYCLGADFGYMDKMHAVLTDASGAVADFAETDFDPGSPADAVRAVMRLSARLGRGVRLSGAAAAVSGITDGNGKILRSIHPALEGNGLYRELSGRFGLPVCVENRSRMSAVSEAFGGAAAGKKDFALISLGRSIGAAFFRAGELYSGLHGVSGEIRSLRLSSGAVLEDAMLPESIRKNGETETARLCAEGLGQFLAITGLDCLVLAGRFEDLGEPFRRKLEAFLPAEFRCRVLMAEYGKRSAARGAAFHLGESLITQFLNQTKEKRK